MKKYNITIITKNKEIKVKSNNMIYIQNKISEYINCYKIKDNYTNKIFECLFDYSVEMRNKGLY